MSRASYGLNQIYVIDLRNYLYYDDFCFDFVTTEASWATA